jgi:hypothetical protein
MALQQNEEYLWDRGNERSLAHGIVTVYAVAGYTASKVVPRRV